MTLTRKGKHQSLLQFTERAIIQINIMVPFSGDIELDGGDAPIGGGKMILFTGWDTEGLRFNICSPINHLLQAMACAVQ